MPPPPAEDPCRGPVGALRPPAGRCVRATCGVVFPADFVDVVDGRSHKTVAVVVGDDGVCRLDGFGAMRRRRRIDACAGGCSAP